MTSTMGLGLYTATISSVEDQVKELVDLMGKLRVRARSDLLLQAGYSEESLKKVTEYTDKERVNRTIADDIRMKLNACIEQSRLMDKIKNGEQVPEDLSSIVESQEGIVVQRTFDHILSDPSIPATMLRHWGPAWAAKIDEALERLEQPSQIPSETVQVLQATLEGMQNDNARLREENAKLGVELEVTGSVLAEKNKELELAAERVRFIDRQLETSRAEVRRLQGEVASLSEALVVCNEQCQQETERANMHMSLVLASIDGMEGFTDSLDDSGEDWNVVSHYLKTWPNRLPPEHEYHDWLWMDAWSRSMDEADTARFHNLHVNQALLKLFFVCRRDSLVDCDYETMTLLQCIASSLASSTSVEEGLCRMIVDLIRGQPACEIYIALVLSQILSVIAQRWPTVGADASQFLQKQSENLSEDDMALMQAILSGPQGNA